MEEQLFSVIIPVGPSDNDPTRIDDLLHSLFTFERMIYVVVLINNSGKRLKVSTRPARRSGFLVMSLTIPNIPNRASYKDTGRLAATILYAMRWISCHTRSEFVLKLDADALVISSFSDKIMQTIVRYPRIGILGSVGRTVNPNSALFHYYGDARKKMALLFMNTLPPEYARAGSSIAWKLELNSRRVVMTSDQIYVLQKLKCRTAAALENGYVLGKYCQGGAYIVTQHFLHRMNDLGFFADWRLWPAVPLGEDMILSMYVYAVGLKIADPRVCDLLFGIQWRGLPYRPEELSERGFCFIHSIKNDIASESQLRLYYQQERRGFASGC